MFGMRIRELRLKKGLTQVDLSRQLDVSQATIAGWEKEVNLPNTGTLQRLAQYFGVSTDYLLGNDPPQSQSFSPDETKLIHIYRRLNDADRQTAFRILSSLSAPAFAHA